MSTITSARFWKDTGFTEGCLEVPKNSAPQYVADLTFTDLNPTKARMFSELRVPEDYVTMLDYSYMAVTVDNNNGSDKTFYGWIDSVEMLSDTANAPITQVNWHVDLWRTYFAQAEFGSGMVRRRTADTSAQPPQQPSYRYMVPGAPISIYQNDGIWWVIVALTVEDTTDNTVTVEYRLVPVSYASYTSGLYISGGTVTAGAAMPLRNIFIGDWDEKWGIDPNRVISVFLSPVCPTSFSGTGTSADPINMGIYWDAKGTSGSMYFTGWSSVYPFEDRWANITPVKTTDTERYEIRGFDGETVGILPWEIPVDRVNVRLVYSTTSAYVQIRFRPQGQGASYDYTLSHQYGLTFNIPCWALDVTENTWSSYVYSTQRQYDMEQRKLSTESNAVSGGLSIGASALTGAASGAMLGSAVPGIGTLVGGVVGAIGGIVTGAISTIGGYAYDTGYKNDEMQRMEDYAHANQADNILLPGNGLDCIVNGCQLTMVAMTIDSYSATQYNNDIAIYGVKVCEPTADCTTLINAGGPIQIQNLIVKGDIPPAAKVYIKQRIEQGVLII